MDLSRYTALFLADSTDHLRRSSAMLVEWEHRPDSSEPVDELFRCFHSLKGSAASMGYDQVAELAHQAESVLDAVRRKRLAGSPAVIGLLSRAVDQLERGVEAAVSGTDGVDAAPITEALERLVESATPSTVAAVDFAVTPPAAPTDHSAPAQAPAPAPRAPRRSAAHRAPSGTARVDPAKLDELLQRAGELVVARNRLAALSTRRTDPELEAISGQVDSLVRTLHAGVVRARLAPIGDLFDRFPRVVRELGASLDKAVRLELQGEGIELDRAVLEELVDPMIHLIRNAVDHGIESPAERLALGKSPEGRIVLAAERRRDWVVLRLSDDGRGIPLDRVRERAVELGCIAPGDSVAPGQLLGILARPGFTLKRQVTAVSGRGIGMDAVMTKLRGLGGGVELATEPGRGTTFELHVPMTTAIQTVLLVGIERERYAIPFRLVREALLPTRGSTAAEERDTIEVAERLTATLDEPNAFTFRMHSRPVVDLARAVGAAGGEREAKATRRPRLVLEWGTREGVLVVDHVLGQHDVLIERVEAPRGTPAWISGVTILADGSPAFVLDPTALF